MKTAIHSTKVAKIRIAAGIDARNIDTQHADIEGFSGYEASVIILFRETIGKLIGLALIIGVLFAYIQVSKIEKIPIEY